jgi:3-phosphoshikimate 1-carboxyvinyltransferase
MKRIIEPLSLMGAKISSQDFRAPLNICGSNLTGITYESKIASAQVKSCVLLAGLFADGVTKYKEIYPSRNHTEVMLKNMGANIFEQDGYICVEKSELEPFEINICGDISSCAYFIVAGLIVPKSKIILKNIGLNPTRSGIVEIVKQMGGNIEILAKKDNCGETVGDIKVEYSPDMEGVEIGGNIIPALIDEITVISV